MALIPKTAVLQIRLDPDLLADFKAACEAREGTASAALRFHIRQEVAAYHRHLAQMHARGVSGCVVRDRQGVDVKTPPSPVKSVHGVKSRAQRRAEKRDK